MSSIQPNREQLSLILSDVLDDIGLNDEMIKRRRQSSLVEEEFRTACNIFLDNDNTTYINGSKMEGSTTIGLDSDEDILSCLHTFHVINDWAYWKSVVKNLLMVQDETTAPGYCVLQLLRDDAPLVAEYIPDDNFCIDNKGRILLKNTVVRRAIQGINLIPHGAALNRPIRESLTETDIVLGFRCTEWPEEARRWLTRGSVGEWPSVHLKRQCKESGCFVIPIDSKISELVGVEWRISTTLAERYLMFSLDTIHIKCYTMTKILLKSFPEFHDVISSYMCKTALFHCVENTTSDFWNPGNLITCLEKLLCVLYNFINHMKCPQFIIPENNLMAGRITHLQQQRILQVLENIIRSEGRMLLDIQLDNIGDRIRQKLNTSTVVESQIISRFQIHCLLSGLLHYCTMRALSFCRKTYSIKTMSNLPNDAIKELLLKLLLVLCKIQLNNQQQEAIKLLPLLCTTIGSLMASLQISIDGHVPDRAIKWLKFGLKSDISSSWLKLATIYYSVGKMDMTVDILSHVDRKYDRDVVLPVCACNDEGGNRLKEGFSIAANYGQVTISKNVSFCVMFTFNEHNIVPKELHQEFFRSTQEEKQRRHELEDDWMDLAVVDSLPYLYLLQYKTYSTLGMIEDKHRALDRLKNVVNEEPNIRHKETVFNILGQCMEQENLQNDAFHFYEKSLQVRPRNNAANFHIARL